MPQPPPSTNRVVGYIRVSTDLQAEHGVSLDAQRAKLAAYALAMDLVLVGIEEDAGVSAKSLDRPGLQRALARLREGSADGILVVKLDRLTRSVRDLGELLDGYFGQRYALLSVGDNIDTRSAAGRLVLNVLCSVAQWEREAIGERVKDALAHLKAQGKELGAPRLEHRPDHAATVERIRSLRKRGLSLRSIAHLLREEGVPTLRGGRWCSESVRKVALRGGARPPVRHDA
jgi:DNA invertase Pin-like site-specific DNA recombinase